MVNPKLRQHSCSLAIDYDRKVVFCQPEEGKDGVILTTAALYAWHCYKQTTSKGLYDGPWLSATGGGGDHTIYTLLRGYKIVFLNSKSIHFYGMLVPEQRGASLFGFDENSSRNILGTPFLYRKSAFISHASEDKTRVKEICAEIYNDVEPWLDEKDILAGDSIISKINEGLENSDCLILCLSSNSVEKDWVVREYAYAIHRKIKIIPILLDKCEPPPVLIDIKYIDYTKSTEQTKKSLIEAVCLS